MDCGKGSTVVKVLGYVLERLVDMNRYVSCGTITKFQSLFVPEVTIEAYLERIEKYARCSESCYVIALIYIDRIVEMKNFVVSSLNVHRVVVTSILLAAKYIDDFHYNNKYFAKLGGVTVAEMNSLELTFLRTIEFSLHVTSELYTTYHRELRRYGASADMTSPLSIADLSLYAPIQRISDLGLTSDFAVRSHYGDISRADDGVLRSATYCSHLNSNIVITKNGMMMHSSNVNSVHGMSECGGVTPPFVNLSPTNLIQVASNDFVRMQYFHDPYVAISLGDHYPPY